ncbi:hypothetical protein AS19_09770 [Alcanivorax sp. NBRC 101098]|nr:hypothetical protein AS19_09770 [Alcanivorax sp. NBRC 101098]
MIDQKPHPSSTKKMHKVVLIIEEPMNIKEQALKSNLFLIKTIDCWPTADTTRDKAATFNAASSSTISKKSEAYGDTAKIKP